MRLGGPGLLVVVELSAALLLIPLSEDYNDIVSYEGSPISMPTKSKFALHKLGYTSVPSLLVDYSLPLLFLYSRIKPHD